MRKGDIVRFKSSGLLKHDFPSDIPWVLGLLIKYESWEKIATVLYNGRLIRVRAADIQKAGKKDESR